VGVSRALRSWARKELQIKRSRHTPEQVIRKLREAERLIGEERTIPEAAKRP